MLSDEERKALEILKDREYDFDELYGTFGQSFIKPYDKSISIILELIEKQSKEIEELKKDKLELINKNHVVHLKDVEKELREMKKVIDTKNAEIECLNVIHESYKEMVEENNFISKDKIKAKIEEYKKQIEKMEKDDIGRGFTLGKEWSGLKAKVEFGQSLLEKE